MRRLSITAVAVVLGAVVASGLASPAWALPLGPRTCTAGSVATEGIGNRNITHRVISPTLGTYQRQFPSGSSTIRATRYFPAADAPYVRVPHMSGGSVVSSHVLNSARSFCDF